MTLDLRAISGFAVAAALVCAPVAAQDWTSSPPEIFTLDTLSLEAARAADSLRAVTSTDAALGHVQPDASATHADAPGAALEGTRAGRGSISGHVVSETHGVAVAGVRVIVTGQNLSAETDRDGNFGIADVAPGTYSLFLYHGSYDPLTIDDLAVTTGRNVARRLSLPDKALRGEAVRITGTAGRAGEAGLLFAQKNAPAVSDGISSEQISKSPDSDAAAALKRVTGISVGGDGLVYVRGLGERYVNMQLNGLNISSPDPDKRIVPLDMFPTRLLENLTVAKTFTADQPAEFAGGSLQLRTRGYPDERLIEFSASAGYEPGATFGEYLTYKGGKWDWLGIDDGTRAIPASVPRERFNHALPALGNTPEERQEHQRKILDQLPNVWTPHGATAPLNQSYGLSLGNKIPLGGDRIFGWLLGGSYSRNFSVEEEFVGRIIVDNEGDVSYRDRIEREIHADNVKWGMLGTATLQDGPRHTLRLNFLLNRDWEDEVRRSAGVRDADSMLLFELTNAHQTLRNVQLEGEHRLGDGGAKVHWVSALTGASRIEPDQRTSRYGPLDESHPLYDADFPWMVAATGGLQDRYWFELGETGWAGKTGVEAPFTWGWFREGSRASGGLYALGKSRDYSVRRLSYNPGAGIANAPEKFGGTYEDFFDLFNGAADSGYISNDRERRKDDYGVDDFQGAAWVQADVTLSGSWRAIAGVRLAQAHVQGRARAPQYELSSREMERARCVGGECEVPFGYDRTALLPAFSVVHALTGDQNLRASWARTFSYPEYREMAPMLFISYQESMETAGNIALKPTDIQNYDLRWEWFFSSSELLAVSGFHKRFTDPVEVSVIAQPSNNRATFTNAPSAQLWGAEWELRADLGRFHEVLSAFQTVSNFTWIYSEVEGAQQRAMQGQSPWLVNVILFFEPASGNTRMSLLYNRFGRRIAKIGVGAFPDVYEEARESLEFSWTQTITRGFKLKFSARDLTAAAKVETQGGLTVRRIENTPTFSLGATYAF